MILSATFGRHMAIAIALAVQPLSGAAAATSPGDAGAAVVVRGDGVRPLERLAQKQTDPEQTKPGTPGGAPGGAPGMRPAPEAGGPSDAVRRGATPYKKQEPEPKGQSDKKKSERERTDK